MASIRMIKKDIDYLIQELIDDCYLTIYFRPDREEKVVEVLREAVEVRNELYERVNNPAEKNNRHLVKRHYSQIRRDMFQNVDGMFNKLSELCKGE